MRGGDAFIIRDGAGHLVDDFGIGVRKQVAEQGRFLARERQGGEGRLGTGGGLGLGEKSLGSLRPGQS